MSARLVGQEWWLKEDALGKSVADISMSLDGFVTGPDPCPDSGLGTGGEPLHAWAVGSTDDIDAAVLRETTEATGAVVMGRRLFDVVDGPFGWDDEMGYGAGLAAMPPVFVVTHTIPTAVRLGARFRFVRDGVAEAIREAHGAANGLDVVVMGGAETVRTSCGRRVGRRAAYPPCADTPWQRYAALLA